MLTVIQNYKQEFVKTLAIASKHKACTFTKDLQKALIFEGEGKNIRKLFNNKEISQKYSYTEIEVYNSIINHGEYKLKK